MATPLANKAISRRTTASTTVHKVELYPTAGSTPANTTEVSDCEQPIAFIFENLGSVDIFIKLGDGTVATAGTNADYTDQQVVAAGTIRTLGGFNIRRFTFKTHSSTADLYWTALTL